MCLRKLLVFSMLLMILSGLVASPLGDEFTGRIRQTVTKDAASAVIEEYKTLMTGLEDLRILQNWWMDLDMEACQSFFHARYLEQQTDPEARYLWVRSLTDDMSQITEARALINAHQSFYWGYRSLSGAYLNSYFSDTPDSSLVAELQSFVDSDMALLRQALDTFPGDDYLLITLMSHHLEKKEYIQAERYALQVHEPGAIQANFERVDRLVKESGRLAAFEQLFPKLISNMIQSGQIPPADSLMMYQYFYLDAMKSSSNWEGIDLVLLNNPELIGDERFSDLLIQIQIARGNYAQALSMLSAALASGKINLANLENTENWGALPQQNGWQELLNQARLQREADLPAIREAALANRKNSPAPLFQFPDIDGNIVRLEDFRGQIVILDFWATWCSPCMQAMPVLDRWMRTSMPDSVKVFSINVWERDPAGAKALMQARDYQMTYLAGDREVSSRFGFDGIPYICIIDQEGNLAWDHAGYSDDLEDILSFWVQELKGQEQ